MRVDRHPYLSREREREAGETLLVLSHGRLVAKMAKAFARHGMDREDLMQEGHIGLVIAARKFDPAKGYRFATYARWWVRSLMSEAVMRNHSLVRPSQSVAARTGFFRNKPPSDMPLDAPLGEGRTLADSFACPAPLPDALAERAIDGAALSSALAEALAGLSPRDRDIVRGRFLGEDGHENLAVLGARHGISKERVRQIEAVALARLRRAMGADENTKGCGR